MAESIIVIGDENLLTPEQDEAAKQAYLLIHPPAAKEEDLINMSITILTNVINGYVTEDPGPRKELVGKVIEAIRKSTGTMLD